MLLGTYHHFRPRSLLSSVFNGLVNGLDLHLTHAGLHIFGGADTVENLDCVFLAVLADQPTR